MRHPSIYRYSLTLGLKSIRHGRFRQSVRRLIMPVNYWRRVEYDFVIRHGTFQDNQRVLDIGSPKLLSLYLAKFFNVKMYATDIDDYFVVDYEFMREVEGIPKQRFHTIVVDG